MTIKVTDIFDIPDGDIDAFDAEFEEFQREFPNSEFKYEIVE